MSTDAPILPAPATPPRRPPKRSAQTVGEHFDSPQRRRRWRKDSEVVYRPELAVLEQKVSAELEGLLNQYDKSRSHESKTEQSCMVDHEDEDATMVPCTAPDWDPHSEGTPHEESNTGVHNDSRSRRILPDNTAHRLYDNWLLLIPALVSEYLGYMQRSQGRLGRPSEIQTFTCPEGHCELKNWDILCLYFDRMTSYYCPSSLNHLLSFSRLDYSTIFYMRLRLSPPSTCAQRTISHCSSSPTSSCFN